MADTLFDPEWEEHVKWFSRQRDVVLATLPTNSASMLQKSKGNDLEVDDLMS